ncbi:hypothetical protein CRG98_014983 [Punica granatum]|uniref:Uncharacterized protein n=1 Tax=Punica granatum TaxID=22663 RepID=A0A2I0K7M3_PUNGR|nr:hypothetical protein CRG98_014983 [Punica granatum]
MKMGGGEDSGRRGRRFPLLGVAATAREDAGDGSKHRLGYAVLGMCVTGVDTAGIEGKSRVFRRVLLVASRIVFLLQFHSLSVKISADLAENRENCDIGDLWAGGDRGQPPISAARLLPGLPGI